MHKRQNLTKCWWTVNSTAYLTLAFCCCCNRNAVCADAISSSSSSSSSPSSTREHILWRLSHLLQWVVLWYCQISLQLSCCFCLLFHFLPLSSWHWPFFSGMLVEILDSHHIHFSMWPLHIHASGSTQEEEGELKDKTSNERLTRSASERSPILTGAPGTCEEGGGERKPLLVTTGDYWWRAIGPSTTQHQGTHTTLVDKPQPQWYKMVTTLYKTPLPRHDHIVQDHYQPHLTIDTHLASRCQLKQKGTKTFFLPRQCSEPPQPRN